jgi:hypothetical protein
VYEEETCAWQEGKDKRSEDAKGRMQDSIKEASKVTCWSYVVGIEPTDGVERVLFLARKVTLN